MKESTVDTTLLAVADPSSYMSVYVSPRRNQHFSLVPERILDHLFSEHGYPGRDSVIRNFLSLSSEQDKFLVMKRKQQDSEYHLWEQFQKSKRFGLGVDFCPIPGFETSVSVMFLGDAYEWSVRDRLGAKRTDKDLLARVIKKCIDDEAASLDCELPPPPFEDIDLFFTVPTTEEDRYVVLDVGILASILRSVFSVKIRVQDFARNLAKSFLSGRNDDRAQLRDGQDEPGFDIQCMLTGKNAYTEAQITDMTTRNNRSWEEYVRAGCSFNEIPRLAALHKVVGSKLYFNSMVGRKYPVEIKLRIFIFTSRNTGEKSPMGVYAQQELLRNDLLPKFAVAIAKLHRPDIFA